MNLNLLGKEQKLTQVYIVISFFLKSSFISVFLGSIISSS